MANMSWEQAAALSDEHESRKGNFLKFKDGDSHTGVVCGQPFATEEHWSEAQNKSVPHTGPGCTECQYSGKKPTLRVKLNFYTGGAMTILQASGTTFASLLAVGKKFPLTEHAVEISRKGTGLDTRYTVMPEPEKISAELRAEIDATPLHEFGASTPAEQPKASAADIAAAKAKLALVVQASDRDTAIAILNRAGALKADELMAHQIGPLMAACDAELDKTDPPDPDMPF
jgi:hypothetical protein